MPSNNEPYAATDRRAQQQRDEDAMREEAIEQDAKEMIANCDAGDPNSMEDMLTEMMDATLARQIWQVAQHPDNRILWQMLQDYTQTWAWETARENDEALSGRRTCGRDE